jgi:putative acetyltransferase
MKITIRNEEPKDIDQVRAIVCAAFPTEAERKLVDALRANGTAIISLVAVNDAEVLGHIMFSPVTTAPPTNAKGIGLAPVAVRPDMQSQGIGSQLIREGLRLCRDLDFDYCVVLGNPKYYGRFGFKRAIEAGIRNEYGEDEAFMWVNFTDCTVTGLAQYAPEFAQFSL